MSFNGILDKLNRGGNPTPPTTEELIKEYSNDPSLTEVNLSKLGSSWYSKESNVSTGVVPVYVDTILWEKFTEKCSSKNISSPIFQLNKLIEEFNQS